MKPLLKPRTPEREAIDKKHPKKKEKLWLYEFQQNDKTWKQPRLWAKFISPEHAKKMIEKDMRMFGGLLCSPLNHPNGVKLRIRNVQTEEIMEFKLNNLTKQLIYDN